MGVLFYSEIPKDNKKQAGVSDRNVSLMLLFYYVHKITGGAAKFREKAITATRVGFSPLLANTT